MSTEILRRRNRSFVFQPVRGVPVLGPAHSRPRSDYGKEFFPSAIDSLLKTGLPSEPERRVVETDRNVLLGQPQEYPATLVASLTRLLSKHANVKAAYLALMHDPAVDSRPHLVIGIEADGDPLRAIQEAGAVAREIAGQGEPVDFVAVQRGREGLDRYLLRETRPFYERTWGARLRFMFGAGRA